MYLQILFELAMRALIKSQLKTYFLNSIESKKTVLANMYSEANTVGRRLFEFKIETILWTILFIPDILLVNNNSKFNQRSSILPSSFCSTSNIQNFNYQSSRKIQYSHNEIPWHI